VVHAAKFWITLLPIELCHYVNVGHSPCVSMFYSVKLKVYKNVCFFQAEAAGCSILSVGCLVCCVKAAVMLRVGERIDR